MGLWPKVTRAGARNILRRFQKEAKKEKCFHNGGQRPPPTFAALRQRRDLIIAKTPGWVFPKGRGRNPSPFGRFKERGSLRGEGNRNPSPLKWRFWLLLSLLTKVTRRRQKERNSKSKSRIFNRFLGTFFRERIIPPEANKRIFSAPGCGTPVPYAK